MDTQTDPHVQHYALVDIDVTEVDPTTAEAEVTYEYDGGLHTVSVVFFLGGTVTVDDNGSYQHRDAIEALRAEIAVELREACLYQRDLNREMN